MSGRFQTLLEGIVANPDQRIADLPILIEAEKRQLLVEWNATQSDRQALPNPDQSRPDLEKTFVAPSTRSEEVLAKIWANLLKLERVGIHDNFFDLGGHSLLAVRLMSQIEKAFGKRFSLSAIFHAPTIEQLAELISQNVVLPNWDS